MVRKIKRKAKKKPESIEALNAQVQAGLKVMTMEQADAIIGEPEAEYNLLGKAVAPLHRMLISLAYNNGMRESDKVKQGWAQHIVLVATLVHYAYALGIRRGRREQLQPNVWIDRPMNPGFYWAKDHLGNVEPVEWRGDDGEEVWVIGREYGYPAGDFVGFSPLINADPGGGDETG